MYDDRTYDAPGNVTLHHPDGSTCTRNLDPHATMALDPGTGASWSDSQAHPVAALDFQGHLEVTEYLEGGAVRSIHAQGTSEVQRADGTHEWFGADGRLIQKTLPDASTAMYSYPGTDTQIAWSDGRAELDRVDGSPIWTRLANGNTSWYDATGRVVVERSGSSATVTTWAEDGSSTSNSGTITDLPGGSFRIDLAQSQAQVRDDHGNLLYEVVSSTESGGIRTEVLSSGETRETTVSGLTVVRVPNGDAVWTQPDGTTTTVSGGTALTSGGRPTSIEPDGSLRIANADGSFTTLLADDSVLRSGANGVSLLVRADGSERWMDALGTRVEVTPTGTTSVFDAVGNPSPESVVSFNHYSLDLQGTSGTWRSLDRNLAVRSQANGLATLSRPDGRLETYGSDGTVLAVRNLDGTLDEHLAGDVIVHKGVDGAIEGVSLTGIPGSRRADGSWLVLAPDGTDHVLKASGQRWIDYRPDGTRAVYYPNSTCVQWSFDGSVLAVVGAGERHFPFVASSGCARVNDLGGRYREYLSDGTLREVQANMSIRTVSPDGTTVVQPASDDQELFGSGVTVSTTDESVTLADSTGIRVTITPGSLQTLTHEYGTNQETGLTHPDGSSWRVLPDGFVVEKDAAGHVLSISGPVQASVQADGTWAATLGDQSVHRYSADGTLLRVTFANGLARMYSSDGSYHIRYADRDESFSSQGLKTRVAWDDGRVDDYRFGRLWRALAANGSTVETVWINTNRTAEGGLAFTASYQVARHADGSLEAVLDSSGVPMPVQADGLHHLSLGCQPNHEAEAVVDATGALVQVTLVQYDAETVVQHCTQSTLVSSQTTATYTAELTIDLATGHVVRRVTTGSIGSGEWEYDPLTGSETRRTIDGVTSLVYGDGSHATLDADGHLVSVAGPFSATDAPEQQTDGSISIVDTTGVYRTWSPDGSRTVDGPGGIETYDSHGRLVKEQRHIVAFDSSMRRMAARVVSSGVCSVDVLDGGSLVLHVDGTIERLRSYWGLYSTTLPDGETLNYESTPPYSVTRSTSGWSRTSAANGVCRSDEASGGTTWTLAQGLLVTRTANGALTASQAGVALAVHEDADGRLVIEDGGAWLWEFEPDSFEYTQTFLPTGVSVSRVAGGGDGRWLWEGLTAEIQAGPEPDGAIRLSFPDGSRVVVGSDFTLQRTCRSGLSYSRLVDGSSRFQVPEGIVISENASGTVVEARDAQGNVVPVERLESGAFRLSLAYGVVQTVHPDLSRSVDGPDGSTMIQEADGPVQWILPGLGTFTTNSSGHEATVVSQARPLGEVSRNDDGSLSITNPSGTITRVGTDLVRRTTSDGNSGTPTDYHSDGRQFVEYPDGRVFIVHPDGTTTYTNASGGLESLSAQGLLLATTRDADGSVHVSRADGSILTWDGEGASTASYSNGVRVLFNLDASQVFVLPDGTRLMLGRSGAPQGPWDPAGTGYYDPLYSRTDTGVFRFDCGDGRTGRLDPDGTLTIELGSGVSRRELVLHGDGSVDLQAGTSWHMHVTSMGVISGADVYGNALSGTANADGSWAVWQANGSTLTWNRDLTDTYTPPADSTAAAALMQTWTRQVSQGGPERSVQADGSVLFTLPSGLTVMRTIDPETFAESDVASDASPVSLLPDGTWSVTGTDGFTDTVHPDLTWVRTDTTSTVWRRTQHPDGSVERTNYDGSTATVDGTGTVTALHTPDGSAPAVQSDGTWTATRADGSVTTWDAHGTLLSRVLTLVPGLTRTLEGDGTMAWAMPDGTWLRVRGTQLTAGNGEEGLPVGMGENGSLVITLPDGKWTVDATHGLKRYSSDFFNAVASSDDPERTLVLEVLWNGDQRTHQADGSVATRTAAGLVTVATANGEAAQVQEDGSFAAVLPDGSVSRYDSLGHLVGNAVTLPPERSGYQSDGTTFWEFASGMSRTLRPDGEMTWTVPVDGATTLDVSIAADTRIPTVTLDGETLVASWATSAQISYAAVPPLRTGRLEIDLPDGSHGWLFTNGLWMRSGTDGTTLAQVIRPDGIHTSFAQDGTPSSVDADGQPVAATVNTDGTFNTTGSWGDLTVTGPDTWNWQTPSGLSVSYALHGDHLQQWTLPDGLVLNTGWDNGAEGWQFDWWSSNADVAPILYQNTNEGGATTLRLDMDGRVTTSHQNGSTVVLFPNGQQWLTQNGAAVGSIAGITVNRETDGSVTMVAADGASIVQGPSGREVWTFAEGDRVSQPYGSLLQVVTERSPGEGWTGEVTRDAAGLWTAVTLRNSDGLTATMTRDLEERITSPGGLVHILRADSSEAWTLPGGTTVELAVAGTLTAHDAQGSAMAVEREVGGDIRLTDARGITAMILSTGVVRYQFQGVTLTLSGDTGSARYGFTVADGTVVTVINQSVVEDQSHDSLGGSARFWNHTYVDTGGNVHWSGADGSSRTFPNLARIFGTPAPVEGTVGTLEDGSTAQDMGSGLIEIRCLSGAVELHACNGLTRVVDVDGWTRWQLPDGTWVQLDPQGHFPRVDLFPTMGTDVRGLTTQQDLLPDGSLRVILRDGTVYRVAPETFTLITETADGREIRAASDGTFTQFRDGILVDPPQVTTSNPDGSTATHNGSTGEVTMVFAEAGTVSVSNPDGSITATSPSGVKSVYDRDGVLLSRVAGGQTRTYRRNGTVSSMAMLDQVHVTFAPDGSHSSISLPDGTVMYCTGTSPDHAGTTSRADRLGYAILAYQDYDDSLVIAEPGGRVPWRIEQDYTLSVYDEAGSLQYKVRPDGSTERYDRFGTLTEVDRADGSKELHQADGSVKRLAADGAIVSMALVDGTMASLEVDGSWLAIQPDGAVTRYDASGAPLERTLAGGTGTVTYHGDRSRTEAVGGIVTEYGADGLPDSAVLADGSTVEFDDAGRRLTVTHTSGEVESYEYRADGTTRITSTSGAEQILREDGSLMRRRTADGTITAHDFQGRRSCQIGTDGLLTTFTYAADGSSTGVRSDGQVDSYDGSGRLIQSTLPDGSIVEHATDGVVDTVQRFPNRLVITRYLDGRTAWTQPDGQCTTRSAEGQVTTEANQGLQLATTAAEDGSVHVTQEDGSIRVVMADGSIERLASDGKTPTETIAVSGTRVVHSRYSTTTYDLDGSVTVTDLTGALVRQTRPDGSYSLKNADGWTTEVSARGNVLQITRPDGSTATYDASNGDWEGHFEGTLYRFSALDGRLCTSIDVTGAVTTYTAGGARTVVSPDGDVQYWASTGSLGHEVSAAGVVTYYDDSGQRTVREHPNGTRDFYESGRLLEARHPDGSVTHYTSSGWSYTLDLAGCMASLTTESGATMVRAVDGTVEINDSTHGLHLTVNPTGTVCYRQDDGSMRIVDAEGHLLSLLSSSGSPLVAMADGTFSNTVSELDYGDDDESDTALFVFGTSLYDSAGHLLSVSWSTGHLTTYDAANGPNYSVLPDGLQFVASNGVVTRYCNDGRRITIPLQGTPVTDLADGTRLAADASGNAVVTELDGSIQEVVSGGAKRVRVPDGSLQCLFSGGVIEYGRDNVLLLRLAQGDTLRQDEHGRLYRSAGGGQPEELVTSLAPLQLGCGAVFTYRSSGVSRVTFEDGTWQEFGAGGVTAHADSSETVVTVTATGQARTQAEDGTRLTVQPDGTQILESQGAVIVTTPDGSTLTTVSGGEPQICIAPSSQATYDSALKVLQARGEDGQVTSWGADGSVTTLLTDGSRQVIDSYGNETVVLPNGRVYTMLADGTQSATSEEGTTTLSVSGDTTLLRSDGTGRTDSSDGSTTEFLADGTRFTVSADGKTHTTHLCDGSSVTRLSDGTFQVAVAEGSGILGAENGTWVTSLSDGRTVRWIPGGDIEMTADGGSVYTLHLDGSSDSTDSAGTVVKTDRSGNVTETRVDGTKLVQLASGQRFISGPDGTASWQDGAIIVSTDANGSVTRRDATGLVTRTDGDGTVTTWGAGQPLRCSSPLGLRYEADVSGRIRFTSSRGDSVELCADGSIWAPKTSAGDFAHLASGGYLLDLGGGASLKLEQGSWKLTRRDGTSSEYTASGDNLETRLAPDGQSKTTVTRANGSLEIIEGSQRRVYNPDDLSVATYDGNTLVSFLDADGVITRAQNGHTISDLGNGLVLVDGRTPRVQLNNDGVPQMPVLHIERFGPDSPYLAAAEWAHSQSSEGRNVIWFPDSLAPSLPSANRSAPQANAPQASSSGILESLSGLAGRALTALDGLIASRDCFVGQIIDGSVVVQVSGGTPLLVPIGSVAKRLMFYVPFNGPGFDLTRDDQQSIARIKGWASKPKKTVETSHGDVFYQCNVVTAEGDPKTYYSNEFPPEEQMLYPDGTLSKRRVVLPDTLVGPGTFVTLGQATTTPQAVSAPKVAAVPLDPAAVVHLQQVNGNGSLLDTIINKLASFLSSGIAVNLITGVCKGFSDQLASEGDFWKKVFSWDGGMGAAYAKMNEFNDALANSRVGQEKFRRYMPELASRNPATSDLGMTDLVFANLMGFGTSAWDQSIQGGSKIADSIQASVNYNEGPVSFTTAYLAQITGYAVGSALGFVIGIVGTALGAARGAKLFIQASQQGVKASEVVRAVVALSLTRSSGVRALAATGGLDTAIAKAIKAAQESSRPFSVEQFALGAKSAIETLKDLKNAGYIVRDEGKVLVESLEVMAEVSAAGEEAEIAAGIIRVLATGDREAFSGLLKLTRAANAESSLRSLLLEVGKAGSEIKAANFGRLLKYAGSDLGRLQRIREVFVTPSASNATALFDALGSLRSCDGVDTLSPFAEAMLAWPPQSFRDSLAAVFVEIDRDLSSNPRCMTRETIMNRFWQDVWHLQRRSDGGQPMITIVPNGFTIPSGALLSHTSPFRRGARNDLYHLLRHARDIPGRPIHSYMIPVQGEDAAVTYVRRLDDAWSRYRDWDSRGRPISAMPVSIDPANPNSIVVDYEMLAGYDHIGITRDPIHLSPPEQPVYKMVLHVTWPNTVVSGYPCSSFP